MKLILFCFVLFLVLNLSKGQFSSTTTNSATRSAAVSQTSTTSAVAISASASPSPSPSLLRTAVPIDSSAPCGATPVFGVGDIPSITEFGSTKGNLGYFVSQCNPGNSPTAWYSFSAPYNSVITLTTCSSYTNFDTILGVYTGSCYDASCRFSNDDSVCGTGSTVEFTSQGIEYFIAVSGYSGQSGNYELTISSTKGSDPSCARATPIDGPYIVPVTVEGSNYGSNHTDVNTCGITSSSYVNWYTITPLVNKALVVSTCSDYTNFDTRLAIFSGSCSDLYCTSYNDDNCTLSSSNLASTISFVPTNSSYIVAVLGYGSYQGSYALTISQNDVNAQTGCFRAFPVSADKQGSIEGTNANGDVLNAAICSSENGPAIWYRVSSSTYSTVTFSTCNDYTNFDTVLSVYTGSCNSLQCLTYNDDACSANRSSVTIDMAANSEVYLIVSGYSGQTGTFVVDITVSNYY